MQIAVLGTVEVRDPVGRPVEIGGPRLRALLARLALDAGRTVSTETLIDELWGDTAPSGAANALQSLVSRLRRALPDPSRLESSSAGYRLAVAPDDVDGLRAQRLAGEGRAELRAGRHQRAAELLAEAETLWRGGVLAGLLDAPFAQPAAARLEELRLAAAEDRIEAELALGHGADVLDEVERLAAAHPLRERIQDHLIRALYAVGRQAEALDAYERVRTALADQLGIDPSAQLQETHLAVLRSDPALSAPATDERRTNLPSRLTSFVGRDDDIGALTRLVDSSRLITLVGPGGAGKTRLATEAASRLGSGRPDIGADGVWFVELAPVGNPRDVAPAVLSALGLGETVRMVTDGARLDRVPTGVQATERLTEALATRRTLLVLDNCEHVVSAVAALAEALLRTCPDLRIVATSREPLAIAGERLYPVGPLRLPPARDGSAGVLTDPAEALSYAAVRLMVDRAVAVLPAFVLDTTTLRPVLEICERLDGMPLAIELAAARLRSLSAAQIAHRLDDRFRLLTNGGRTVLPRHQTLRAVVEWSWELLDKPERTLLRRLSVFAGGASLDAVERICSDEVVRAGDVLDLLASLVDKSLVEAVGTEQLAGEVRYRLLETVRAYAGERLAEADETTTVAAAHAEYFRELMELADPHLRRSEQLEWLARLTVDYDNILTALRWAIEVGDAELAARIVAVHGWYWALKGNSVEARTWLSQVVAMPGKPSQARMFALVFHTIALIGDAQVSAAMRSAARARRMARRADLDAAEPIPAFLDTMWTAVRHGFSSAAVHLAGPQANPDPWIRGMAHLVRSQLAENDGDAAAYAKAVTDGLVEFRAAGDRWGTAMVLVSAAGLDHARGAPDEAVRKIEEGLEKIRELGTVDDVPMLLNQLGLARAMLGDVAGAWTTLDEALHEAQRYGVDWAVMHAHAARGWLARRQGDLDTAREHYELARTVLPSRTDAPDQGRAVVQAGQAQLALARGEPGEAERLLAEAVPIGLVTRDMPVLATLVQVAAAAAHAAGNPDSAAHLLGVATALRGMPDLGDPDRQETENAVRAALGDDAYAAAYERGATVSRDAALEVARDSVVQVRRR